MIDSLAPLYIPGSSERLRTKWASVMVVCLLAIPLVVLAFRTEGSDFRAYHVAAKATAAHLDPYLDNRQFGEQFADTRNEHGISRFIYPPAALFFAIPLGWLSFFSAKIVFGLLSIASLIWVLLFLAQRSGIALTWQALAVLSLPVVACVQRGQIDLLILFCIVLAFRFSGSAWAGVPLGIAISIKVFPAALLLWWLLDKRFKEAITAIAVTIGLNLLALGRFGAASYAGFFHNLTTLHASPAAGHLALPQVATGPWFSLSPGFVGSYNNPLVVFDKAGFVAGILFTATAVLLLHHRRVASEVGFFSVVVISQLMNTTLWTMGMVMYIPISLIAVSRMRSKAAALLLLIPLYLPSQIRVFGVNPRLIIALALIAWIAARSSVSDDGSTRVEDLNGHLASA